MTKYDQAPYTGRFAPTPSGSLHLGSLVCALASYLDAKAHSGRWLLRIDDIDQTRNRPEALDHILSALQSHQLYWDGDSYTQSQQHHRYQTELDRLQAKGYIYRCSCNRKRLLSLNGIYDGHCIRHPEAVTRPFAQRIHWPRVLADAPTLKAYQSISDGLQGEFSDTSMLVNDTVLTRRDGLFAYNFATSIDEVAQGITHVVRGIDLLPTTPQQQLLMQLIFKHAPNYFHIPVLTHADGRKLSKQNHSPAIDIQKPEENLRLALTLLGVGQFDANLTITQLLEQATGRWQLSRLQSLTHIEYEPLSC